ncbi:helix-turn-helix domain-containing protein [Aliiroseovarius crassostreae]|uniref:helix-turn-helix domain-containing protein n=1 Tax=Aliiroseovarius crassostreae TaxID=154981 RepID=UPI003C79E2F8
MHLAVLTAAHDHAHDLITHIEHLKGRSAAQRLSEFLLGLYDAKGASAQVTLPYGKKVLAGKLGIKPESLSRAFRQLIPVGVQNRDRLVQISNVAGLRDFAGDRL